LRALNQNPTNAEVAELAKEAGPKSKIIYLIFYFNIKDKERTKKS
jgi:hypothetical protein